MVDDAIDLALLQLPALLRPLGKERMKATARICSTYDILVEGGRWQHSCDGRPPLEGPLDGSPFTFAFEDRSVPVSLVQQGSSVQASFQGDNGERRNTWTFDPSGLRLDVSIASDHLAEPLSWSLRYQRR